MRKSNWIISPNVRGENKTFEVSPPSFFYHRGYSKVRYTLEIPVTFRRLRKVTEKHQGWSVLPGCSECHGNMYQAISPCSSGHFFTRNGGKLIHTFGSYGLNKKNLQGGPLRSL